MFVNALVWKLFTWFKTQNLHQGVTKKSESSSRLSLHVHVQSINACKQLYRVQLIFSEFQCPRHYILRMRDRRQTAYPKEMIYLPWLYIDEDINWKGYFKGSDICVTFWAAIGTQKVRVIQACFIFEGFYWFKFTECAGVPVETMFKFFL